MTPIKNITGFQSDQKRLERDEKIKRVDTVRKDQPAEAAKIAQSKVIKDSVEISSQGRKISDEQSEITRYLQELTSNRILDDDTVRVVREKISAGFYSRPEVIDKVASALAELPGLAQAAIGTDRDSAESGSTRLESISRKIQDGSYETDDILSEVVERLLDDLRKLEP